MSDDRVKPQNQPGQINPEDPLGSVDEIASQEVPDGVDRRTFLMRSALIGATAVILDRPVSAQERADRLAGTPPTPQLSPTLNVVKEQKGPVMTTLDEFYKVGPGPSSSHTIGPMRITYDFYQRCTKLPADQLAKQRRSRFTCSAASAPRAKVMARSARRSRDWSEKSPRPSIPPFSIACAISRISRSL